MEITTLNNIIVFSATTLGTILMFLAIAFLLLHKEHGKSAFHSRELMRTRAKEVLYLIFATMSALLVAVILKKFFGAPRPFENGLGALFIYGGGDSFPSGHAAFFGALATSVLYLHRNLFTTVFALICLLVPLARVLAGIHYPIDLLAGVLIGAFFSHVFWVGFGFGKGK